MTLQAQVTFNPHPILPHWHDTDLTAITGGPPVGGKIAIAFDPAWGYTRTHYVAGALGDSHVHELAFYGGRWHDADLTLIAGGPNAETPNASEPTSGPQFGGIAIAFDQASNLTRTHYKAVDGHVHELTFYGGRWQDADLTKIAGGPNALYGEIAIVFDKTWNLTRTHYVADDWHVHELALYGGQWRDADLTAIAGAPDAEMQRGIAIAFDQAWGYTRTHYVGGPPWDQHVYELAFYNGRWQDADLTALAGAPNAYGGIVIAFDQAYNFTRTNYWGVDGHVHQLAYGGRWQDADLTAITGGPHIGIGNPVVPPIANAFDQSWGLTPTHYFAFDLHVHRLGFFIDGWHDTDLTAITGGPEVGGCPSCAFEGPPYGGMAIAFDKAWGYERTHYVAVDYHVHELSYF